MCAINGFNFKDEELIKKMNAATKHRGPDGSADYLKEGISLGHNRLGIIDPGTSSDQPMISPDGRLAIIYNGELYNFKELRRELEPHYPFRTKGDTEVILAAYAVWGPACLKKFNGIFAFAIWDDRKKELFFARDPLGVKPFYYYKKNGRFIFSSEIKGLLEHDIPRRLDLTAFNLYLRVLYVPAPLTMFEGIRKLLPGHSGLLKDSVLLIDSYSEEPAKEGLAEDPEKAVEKTVRQAVERQLVSDRPIGIYLSGGIDSTVVLESAAALRSSIDTFSVGFDLKAEEESEKFNSDFNLAKKSAEFYGTKHHEVRLDASYVASNFEKVVWHLDEPISNPTAWALYALSDFTKKTADVVLGGDGGDELFGGYERYRLSHLADLYQKIPGGLRNFLPQVGPLSKMNIGPGIDRFSQFMFQKDKILSRAVEDSFYQEKAGREFFQAYFKQPLSLRSEDDLMKADRQTWLIDFALMIADKMSMGHGLEQRVPLLDREVYNLAAQIPTDRKISAYDTKIILKKAFSRFLPGHVLGQPKRGFFSPGAKWLRDPALKALAEEMLSPGFYAETAKLMDFEKLKEILAKHLSREEYNLSIIWCLMTFQSWAKTYNVKI